MEYSAGVSEMNPTGSEFSTGHRLVAWLVHAYTGLGLPLAFLGTLALWEGNARTFFVVLAAAAVVDATDGTGDTPPATRYGTARRRITDRPGADVLPVFDSTGTLMMWTSQMGGDGSSQLWVAPFISELEMVSSNPGSS